MMRHHGRFTTFCLLIATAATWAPLSASGEVFVLKSGGRVDAEHLNPQREPGQPYQLRTVTGVRLTLADSLVKRVVVKSNLDKEYEARLPKIPNTAAGQWAMAEWCKDAGLLEERKRHLQAVILLEPDHEEARKALGYHRYGSRWLTPDEYLQSQGYIRYKGTWRLKQEIEIDTRERQRDLAEKQWRRDIRRWLGQVADGGRHAETAERDLNQIRDPQAAPALAEILADSDQPAAVRQRCLDILAKLPPGLVTMPLIRLALHDSDDNIRDRCLEELKRAGTHIALPAFLAELKHKDNQRVNRGAECLGALGDKDATLPLINALVTEHIFQVSPGSGGGGGGGMPLSFGTSGGPGQGGLGSFGVGGKPKVEKRALQNSGVLGALTSLHSGVNFQFDVDSWKKWYIQNQTTTNVNLRRVE